MCVCSEDLDSQARRAKEAGEKGGWGGGCQTFKHWYISSHFQSKHTSVFPQCLGLMQAEPMRGKPAPEQKYFKTSTERLLVV